MYQKLTWKPVCYRLYGCGIPMKLICEELLCEWLPKSTTMLSLNCNWCWGHRWPYLWLKALHFRRREQNKIFNRHRIKIEELQISGINVGYNNVIVLLFLNNTLLFLCAIEPLYLYCFLSKNYFAFSSCTYIQI